VNRNLKHKVAAFCLAIGALLALAAPAAAAPTVTPESVSRDAHADDGSDDWINNNLYGYDSFVQVCTIGFNTDADNRVAEAAAVWSNLGGELKLSYAGWSDSTCAANWAANATMVRVTANGDNGGNNLGTTNCYRGVGGNNCGTVALTEVVRCDIDLDMDNDLDTWGSYTWNLGTDAPTSSEVDFYSVMLHEMGHCITTTETSEDGDYIMNGCLAPTDTDYENGCPNPKGINKEAFWIHDVQLYTSMYGTTH
jgi:hypothetical protein